jgi:Ti-type conjugative transfer relaxase TraA
LRKRWQLVAIEHLSVKIVRRSQGDSAVAGAAYRHAMKLMSERTGRTADMRWKQPGVLHGEFMAPPETPAWLVADAQTFWNHVERCEMRVDSRLAREVEFALPRELTPEQNLALAREIIQEQFVRHGMIAHFAIHEEGEGDDRKPHVHGMLTMRRVGPEGFSRYKERAWDSVELLEEQRAGWAASTNRHLAMAGHEVRVDNRSYKRRGIELEPQPKVGRASRSASEDGRDVVRKNAEGCVSVRVRNADRLLVRPEIAFNYLTSQRSTFTLAELKRFLTSRTLDEEQYEDALLLALASPELVRLPDDKQGRTRFTSRAEVQREDALVVAGSCLAQTGSHPVDEELVAQAIALAPHQLNEGQVQGIRHMTSPSALSILEGVAGSGKSSVVRPAAVAWQSQGYHVVGGALANTATDTLGKDAGIPTRTLYQWLKHWKRGEDLLSARDVFIIDEAGMVGTKQCAEITQYVREAGAKLVLVGDPRQLPAIDPGAPMRLLASRLGSARLTEVVRQKQPWQAALTLQFATDQTAEALTTYHEQGHVLGFADSHAAAQNLIERWNADRKSAPDQSALLLAYRREDVRLLNELARNARRLAGELGPDQALETPRGLRCFAAGDRIVFYKTDHQGLGVKNGTLGALEWCDGPNWAVRLDDGSLLDVDTRQYDSIDHGYAGTLHKGQCATVDRAYVLASPHLDAAGVYVAMSRHRHDAHIFYSREEFGTAEGLIKRVSREVFVPMAHELDLLRAERIVAAFEDERLFASVPQPERMRVLASLERAAEQKPLTHEQALSVQKQVVAAERERTDASQAWERAKLELAEYLEKNRMFGKWHSRTAELEEAVTKRHEELQQADEVLHRLRADPRLQRQAEEQVVAYSSRLEALGQSLRRLLRLERRTTSVRQIDQYVRAENARHGRVMLRAATSVDEGQQFELKERLQGSGGAKLLVLQGRNGGPLLVANAAHCRIEHERTHVRFQWRAVAPSLTPARSPSLTRGLHR